MKLEITKTVVQKETIEIELPYYYEHDLMLDEADVVIYGKVEENQCTTITISMNYRVDCVMFELSIESLPASKYGSYMTSEHKSSEAEYLAAKAKLLTAVAGA